jgi:hypothetical protein
LFFEMAVRIHVFGTDALSFTKMKSLQRLVDSGFIQVSEHSEVVFELRPNVDGVFKLVPFVTNSRGLRDDEYSLKKPPGVYRIAVVGDSFSMGSGVRIEDTYHSRLERRLNASGDNAYEVINFGVSAYGLRNYLGVIDHKVPAYGADLVLVGFCGRNDHRPLPERLFNEPYQVKTTAHSFFHPYARVLWVELRHRWVGAEPEVLTPRQTHYVDVMMARLAQRPKRLGIPVAVVFLELSAYRAEAVGKIVARHGLPFIDASAAIPEGDLTRYQIYKGNAHANAEANALFADLLHTELQSRGLLERPPSSEAKLEP